MRPRAVLSVGNFFASAHYFLIIYILGPYLATFMRPESTGLVISFGAVLTLCVFPFVPRLAAKFGPQTLAISLAALEAIFLTWLAIEPAPIAAILFAALACATSPLIAYQLDLLLETTVTNEGATGRIRTVFLTAGNMALIIAPLVVGFLLDGGDVYGRVFLTAAFSLIPFIVLMVLAPLPRSHAPAFTKVRDAWSRIFADRDLRAIVCSMIMLQFMYQLSQLYIPIYLHNVLGIPWHELGWVFAVVLTPFVLVEYPAGLLADTRLGDRRLLLIGFGILGLGFAATQLVHAGTSVLILVLILLATRLGAALVEAMTEGHFFRRVSDRDANTVSVFRMMRPGAALVAPIVGSLLLSVGSYGMFFLIGGGIILVLGLLSAFSISDVRY